MTEKISQSGHAELLAFRNFDGGDYEHVWIPSNSLTMKCTHFLVCA